MADSNFRGPSCDEDGEGSRGKRGRRGSRGPRGPAGSSSGVLATLTLTPPIAVTLAGGANDNFTPVGGGSASRWRVTAAGFGSNLTGMLTDSANIDGRLVVIENETLLSIGVSNEQPGSVAANRFALPASQFFISAGGAAAFLYEGAIERWRLLSIVSSTLPLASINSAVIIQGGLTVNGYLAQLATAAAVAGAQNDYNPGGDWPDNQTLYLAAGGAVVIGGFDATGLAGAGRPINIVNTSGANTITLTHNDVGSLPANRLFLPNSAPLVVPPYGGVSIVYTAGHWQVVG